jgi:epoxyqueuosine reductase QueG
LQQYRYKAVPGSANFVYWIDIINWLLDMSPLCSHRYLAVCCRRGYFGYSGNIITKKYGSSILLASVVTDAELIPIDPFKKKAHR